MTGPLIFDDESRARLIATVTTDFDPATATIEVAVDNTWHAATWTGAATATGSTWRRPATTTDYFKGTLATGTGTLLAAGRHRTKTRVTFGEEVIVTDSTPIDVR